MTELAVSDRIAMNRLLTLLHVDLLKLNNEDWQNLFDEIALAVHREPRLRGLNNDFNYAAGDSHARSAVGRAKLTLQAFAQGLKDRDGTKVELKVREERYFLWCTTRGFGTEFRYLDLETAIYRTFIDAMRRLELRPNDFAVCADPRCGRLFVPPRKPRIGKRTFCCARHQNRVIVAERRARNKQDAESAARRQAKGRERSHRHYKRKVTAGRPNVKVARRPRR